MNEFISSNDFDVTLHLQDIYTPTVSSKVFIEHPNQVSTNQVFFGLRNLCLTLASLQRVAQGHRGGDAWICENLKIIHKVD